jgi:hypothetical protein
VHRAGPGDARSPRRRRASLLRSDANGGPFTILRFAEPDLPDVVYLEQLTSALYLEAPADVDHYLHVMSHLSADALTPAATARFIKQTICQT